MCVMSVCYLKCESSYIGAIALFCSLMLSIIVEQATKKRKKLLRFQGDFRLFPIGKSEYIPTRATVIVIQPSTWLRYRRPNNGGASQAKGG